MLSKFTEILKEGGVFSLTRILILIGFIAFLVVSGYLVYVGRRWDHYETFATLTGGGSGAFQIMNKLINSKFNTESNSPGKPL